MTDTPIKDEGNRGIVRYACGRDTDGHEVLEVGREALTFPWDGDKPGAKEVQAFIEKVLAAELASHKQQCAAEIAALRRENEELKVHNGRNRAAWEAKKTDLLNELSAEKKRSAAYREVAIDERARRMSGDWPDGVCVREATEFVDAEAQKLLDLPKDGGKTV